MKTAGCTICFVLQKVKNYKRVGTAALQELHFAVGNEYKYVYEFFKRTQKRMESEGISYFCEKKLIDYPSLNLGKNRDTVSSLEPKTM